MTLGDGKRKPAGTWDYYGACDPAYRRFHSNGGFSVGVFRWQHTADGRSTKRGLIVQRFTGHVYEAPKVYAQALLYIASLEKP